MKKLNFARVAIIILIAPFASFSQTILLFDDFQQFEPGNPIEVTGWQQWHSGAGGHKIIADENPSRGNVLQINGAPGWAGEFFKDIAPPAIFTAESYIKVSHATGFNASLSLLTNTNQVSGRVMLWDGSISAVQGNDFPARQPLNNALYQVGEWVHVKIVANNQTLRFSVYINGQLKASGTQTIFNLHHPVGRVLLSGGHNGMDSRFDNVKVEFSRLIAHYPFNGDANDVTVSGNHGTVTGATFIPDRFGNENGAIRFNGTSDQVVCKTAVGPFGSSPRSISFWARTDRAPSGQQQNTVLSYGGNIFGSGNRFEILLNPVCRGIGFDGSTGFVTRAFNNESNDWVFYTVVLDNQIGANINRLQFFANGELLGTTCNEASSSILINTQIESPLHIGRLHDSSHTRFFRGDLDDLKIHSYALSQQEIRDLFAQGFITRAGGDNQTREINIWPNPAGEVLHIELPGERDAVMAQIFNSAGQKILEIPLHNATPAQVDISRLEPGVYFLRAISTEGINTRVFVKSH